MNRDHRKMMNIDKLKNTSSRTVSVTREQLVSKGYLQEGQTLPLVVQPRVPDLDIVRWASDAAASLEEELRTHGAILFRGFHAVSVDTFYQLARSLSPTLVNYVEGSTPRTMKGQHIYTSTEYPPELSISMHNELSYAHHWPSKIFFYCDVAAQQGGETPLANSHQVLEQMPSEIVERFARKRVKYIRNLHGSQGAGLSWQSVFETEDRSVVEQYCREGHIEYRWKENGGLWTSQTRAAIIAHPQTGQPVWFNQVEQWHPLSLNDSVADALLSSVDESDLPLNALYGDDSPLESAALQAIRAAFERVTVSFPWQKGDILLVDNMLVAHGRAPFRGQRKILVAMGSPIGYTDFDSYTL
jgi:alpha-ketoglutarate-dependent taurine dioxygenase